MAARKTEPKQETADNSTQAAPWQESATEEVTPTQDAGIAALSEDPRLLRQSPRIDKILPALLAAQGAIDYASKDAQNPHFKSRYADLPAFWEAIKPSLQANGLFFSQQPFPDGDGGMILRTAIYHVTSSQYITCEMPMYPDLKRPQEVGSWLTYARRYSMAAILSVPQDDDDGEAATSPYRGGNGSTSSTPPARQTQAPPKSTPPASNGNGAKKGATDNREYGKYVQDAAGAFGLHSMQLHRHLIQCAMNDELLPDSDEPLDNDEVLEAMTPLWTSNREWVQATVKAFLRSVRDKQKS